MKRRGFHLVVAVLAVCLLASTHAFAQGGGASTTGSINGKVADTAAACCPGVTVSATSPSSMGVQSSVTDTGGNYRFPALPPGTYTVTFELPGFNTLKRENIQISMGFTATVNVELAVASLQETVTVTGDSPVIDTSNTRVQQNFKLEALQEIPNSRDLWSLLAVTPSVTMGRIDVGGNRAGTQTGYTAYGFSGQNRVLVEGINTTEGTGGAGFYVDYGSFEEVFLGTIGQGAEMPTPGVQSQMLGKSGGNKFQGEFYQRLRDQRDDRREHHRQRARPSSCTTPSRTRAASATAQQRDVEVPRHQHQRRRPDQEGQGLVVLLVSQPEDLGRPAELHRPDCRHDVRHQAVEPVRQGHVPDEPEQQADRLLPVGPEGRSRTACRQSALQLHSRSTAR